MIDSIYQTDHQDFRAAVQGFVARFVTPNVDQHRADKALPRELWLEAGRAGFLGLAIPERFGGSGADDYRFNAVLLEELSKVAAAYASCFGVHADITAPYLVEFGTDAQRERWLPDVAAGRALLAIGMSEPSGGSDLARMRTTAVRDGDGWVINGSKTFITNGYSADLVLIAARTEPGSSSRGITLFAVETTTSGFEHGRKLDKAGQDESDTAELFLQDVRVPPDAVIGELGRGFVHMMTKLPQERLGSAVSNIAHAKQILVETLDYVKQRKAFGQPVGSFQHNKFLLAELFTQLEVAETYVHQCVLSHARGALTSVDAAKAKWWSSQTQNEILDHCVQLFGGYGYMDEYRVSRAWRDARVTKIWAGTNEIMKELIGRDLGL